MWMTSFLLRMTPSPRKRHGNNDNNSSNNDSEHNDNDNAFAIAPHIRRPIRLDAPQAHAGASALQGVLACLEGDNDAHRTTLTHARSNPSRSGGRGEVRASAPWCGLSLKKTTPATRWRLRDRDIGDRGGRERRTQQQ
ncbi:hypothetical protein MSAN_00313300 [Mycena sanguinolenta]|uniref:Uncharacterized protein n=1 Tax=Mycena sanguinolenta TaxID=230812 RepID=A0A8H6ZDI4_9AGAR|nr:hypothetical protein MSAN_00313300 [Mycena sanguinolenta]